MKTFISLLISTYPNDPLLLVHSFPTLTPPPYIHLLRLSVSCRSYPASVCIVSFVSCACLYPASVSSASVCIVSFVSCVCLSRLCLLCLSVYPTLCVCVVSFNIPNDSSGSIVYLSIHSNTSFSISLKSLKGSTCLTGFYLFEVFGVFGVFEVFKGVRLVQRFYSYNPLNKNTTLSKTHNSFSCPYRRNRTI